MQLARGGWRGGETQELAGEGTLLDEDGAPVVGSPVDFDTTTFDTLQYVAGPAGAGCTTDARSRHADGCDGTASEQADGDDWIDGCAAQREVRPATRAPGVR